MSLPASSPKQTFLPLLPEPHPRSDKTLPPTTTASQQPLCTSPTQPPMLKTTKVVPQTVDQDPLLQSPRIDQPPTTIAEEMHAGENKVGGEKLVARPWPVPHAIEQQKHVWYGSMLGMGASKVKDEWGFSSASVSRAHTPDAAGKA